MSQQLLKAAILVVSDTAARDSSLDKCIPVLKDIFGDQWLIKDTAIVPDDTKSIQQFITKHTDTDDYVNLIVTSGGTGFATKDNTPEAISPLIHKHAPGLIHAMLAPGLAITPFAMMARPVAGVRNCSIIITLPGSPKGAKENLEAIIKLLPHACQQASGMDSRTLHAGGIQRLEKEAGLTPGVPIPSQTHNHHHHHHHHHEYDGRKGHPVPVSYTSTEDRPIPNDPEAGPSRRHRKSPYPMLSVEDALALIIQNTPKPTTVQHEVNEKLIGHVITAAIKAPEAVPSFRASIVDGYAVRFPSEGRLDKGVYPVSFVSTAHAGSVPELIEGQVARITTGAPLPPGASAVLMVEDTLLVSETQEGEEKDIQILTSDLKVGDNIREPGSDIQAGDTILHPGQIVSATGGEFGLLASVGVQVVEVFRKPVVGVLSTGDELVPHTEDRTLRLGEVRDTNRPTLLATIKASGFEVIDLGIAADKAGTLEQTLRDALRQVDVVITTGGVSMGELDLLKPTIERALGGTIHFGRVSMKPGKPTTFASLEVKKNNGDRVKKLIFGLPGNPASAVVTFNLFVLPSLHHWARIKPAGLPKVRVKLGGDVRMDPQRREYHRVTISTAKDGFLLATSTGGQRSSRIGSFNEANGLLCLPVGEGILPQGTMVDALLMGRIM